MIHSFEWCEVQEEVFGTCQFTVCPLPTGMTDQRTTYTIEETLRCIAIERSINDSNKTNYNLYYATLSTP